MQKVKERAEYIGDLRAEFQEIDRMYEQERTVEDIISLSSDCWSIYTLICC